MRELAITIAREDDGQTVRFIAMQRLMMSYGQFKRAKFQGKLRLDQQPVFANQVVSAGQRLQISVPETHKQGIRPCAQPLLVAYEDEDMIVVDKPAPLPSVSSAKQQTLTLENRVYSYFGEPAAFQYRPLNRLDKGTSGLMVIAKHAHAQQYLQRRLHGAGFIREYLAVCDGIPENGQGCISAPIQKAEGATIRRIISEEGKPACTDYWVERTGTARSLLRLRLHTGRTHQIRVHLSAMGCPVTGDFLYGTEHPLLPRRFALHSALLELETLQKKHIRLESDLPDVFDTILED